METFSEEMYVDCGKIFVSETPKKEWADLDIWEGKKVSVVADDFPIEELPVENGKITLQDEAGKIIVGLPYEHIIEPLPFMVDSTRPYPPKAYRLIHGIFRIIKSKSLRLDFGNGYFDVPLKKMHKDQILDSPPDEFSGDVELRSIGWIRDVQKPMWSIKSDVPNKFMLLSVANEIKTKE